MNHDQSPPPPADPAAGWAGAASPDTVAAWTAARAAADTDPPTMGLAAGDRPAADVELLASTAATCEYLLATRMHAATASGALPLGQRGGVLAARGWSTGTARRLARAGALASRHPSVAAAWAAGLITSEHVDPIARHADAFTPEELVAVIGELEPLWASLCPNDVARYLRAAVLMLHPPTDPSRDEADAYQTRALSFALTRDSVLLSGTLPRVEGELVIAAIDALADRLRSTADHVPAPARRADALVQLVNHAHATGTLPTRGGLPVSLTVTIEHTALGDPVVTTSRGHQLTQAETRWACCDAAVTPILLDTTHPGCPPGLDHEGPDLTEVEAASRPAPASPAARIAALAALLFDTRIPLAVGRTARTATPAQRRALAARDRGCVIPGCAIPAEACQAHHLIDWADGGDTTLDNLTLLCWAHHRQVDLHMWTITPGRPPGRSPEPGAPPGTTWPANHSAPFTITRTPRHRWRART